MIRNNFFPLLLSACLSACTVGGATLATSIPPAPVAMADKTMLDERAALAVELVYQAAALSLRTAIRADVLSHENLARARAAEAAAYLAVTAARAAYDAGNSDNYTRAIDHAQKCVAALHAILKVDQKP